MLAIILTVLGETGVHFVIMSFDFMSVIEKYIFVCKIHTLLMCPLNFIPTKPSALPCECISLTFSGAFINVHVYL